MGGKLSFLQDDRFPSNKQDGQMSRMPTSHAGGYGFNPLGLSHSKDLRQFILVANLC